MSAPEFMPTHSPWSFSAAERQALEQALAEAEKQLAAPGFKDLPWVERQRRTEDAASLRRQLDLARNELTLSEGQHGAPVASNRAATPPIRAKGKGEVVRVETLANGKTFLRRYVSNGHSELLVDSKELPRGSKLVVE